MGNHDTFSLCRIAGLDISSCSHELYNIRYILWIKYYLLHNTPKSISPHWPDIDAVHALLMTVSGCSLSPSNELAQRYIIVLFVVELHVFIHSKILQPFAL